MKRLITVCTFCCTATLTSAYAIDLGSVLRNTAPDLVQMATISESDVMQQSRAAVNHMDASHKSNEADKSYQVRMGRIVERVTFPKIDGVNFNVKVYKTEPGNLNAFATPDGSIRFHSALMDKMTDDELLAVLGHEIGHVVEKHSFKQMRKALLTNAGIKAAASSHSTAAEAYNMGGGDLANKFLGATFSKKDEISADKYALTVLKEADAPLNSMVDAIGVLKAEFGNGGGMLSSHPSNKKRISKLQYQIKKQSK